MAFGTERDGGGGSFKKYDPRFALALNETRKVADDAKGVEMEKARVVQPSSRNVIFHRIAFRVTRLERFSGKVTPRYRICSSFLRLIHFAITNGETIKYPLDIFNPFQRSHISRNDRRYIYTYARVSLSNTYRLDDSSRNVKGSESSFSTTSPSNFDFDFCRVYTRRIESFERR